LERKEERLFITWARMIDDSYGLGCKKWRAFDSFDIQCDLGELQILGQRDPPSYSATKDKIFVLVLQVTTDQ